MRPLAPSVDIICKSAGIAARNITLLAFEVPPPQAVFSSSGRTTFFSEDSTGKFSHVRLSFIEPNAEKCPAARNIKVCYTINWKLWNQAGVEEYEYSMRNVDFIEN
jgi:hypothetical protein